jgi:transmembrane sensor
MPEIPAAGTPLDGEFLARLFDGSLSAADRERLRQWLVGDPARQRELDQLRALWDAARRAPVAPPSGPAWDRLAHRMAAHDAHQVTPHMAPHVPWPPEYREREGLIARRPRLLEKSRRWIAGGAIAAAAVAVSLSVVHAPASQGFREFTTAAGNRATVTLRDGTRLVLAPATRLRVPADFGAHERRVDLEGEAYFAVVHDAARPFSVHTDRAVAADIGTTFDVRAYREDARVRVAVVEGSVAVRGVARGPDHGHALHAGDVAVVHDTAILILHDADVAAATGWVQGRLAFDGMPLSDVVRELSRTFDLDVTVADSALAVRRVTGAFTDEPVDEILDVIARAVGGRYDRIGRKVVIRARGMRPVITGPSSAGQRASASALVTTARNDVHE